MKKLLLLILIALLLILSLFIVLHGAGSESINILSVTQMKQKSEELDSRIQEASKLASTSFKEAVNSVEDSTKKLQKSKKDYDEMASISTSNQISNASQIEKYEIETLWVKLGNHATSEGAIMKMDVVKGQTNGTDEYDLNFTVTGSYISITDFISSIENDSTLGFKIENFKMGADSEDQLVATFTCRNIAIKDIAETSSQRSDVIEIEGQEDINSTTDANTTTNTTSTNTTGTTNTTKNTNTTKTTNSTTNTNTTTNKR